jgi:BlaI family penicillinase repressor
MDMSFGARELEIMGVLWDSGGATAAEVQAQLSAALAYTTVITILRNLEAKGLVEHEVDGRAHRFRAVVAKQAARRSAVQRLLDGFFGGSPEQLITQLVAEHGLKNDELTRLARLARDEPPARKAARPARRGK